MEKPMAAIFIINSLQNGGAERVVLNQASELAKRNIKVFLICLNKNVYYKVDPHFCVNILAKEKRGIGKLLSIASLCRKLDAGLDLIYNNYRVVLLTSHLPYSHIICRFSRYSRKILYVMHNPQYQFRFSRTVLFKAKLKILYSKRKLIAVSKGVKNELVEEYGFHSENIKSIYNPVCLEDIYSMLEQQTDYRVLDTPYILFVGRLTPEKNIPRLIKAYNTETIRENYKLVILGAGELKDEIDKLINELGLQDYIYMPGWEQNVYKWMESAELLVCSSDYESFGMVLAEALVLGTKVVSTNCRYGPGEIMQGSLSNYLSELSVNDLRMKIIRALENYPVFDKEKIIDKFDVKEIMNRYLQAYLELQKRQEEK